MAKRKSVNVQVTLLGTQNDQLNVFKIFGLRKKHLFWINRLMFALVVTNLQLRERPVRQKAVVRRVMPGCRVASFGR